MVLNQYDSRTGKRRPKWIPTGYAVKGNKKKAEQMLRETLVKHGERYVNYNSEMLFADWINIWLEAIRVEISETTYEGYKMHSKGVIEYFRTKKLKLKDLKARHFSEFYRYQLAEGKINKRTGEKEGYAVRTVRSQKLVITSALNKAVLDEVIRYNPALQVKVTNKSKKKVAKEPRFFTLQELNDFLKFLYTKNDPLTDIIVATTYFGLRRSEVLGIKKSAVDLKKRTLTINYTVVQISTLHEHDGTKTPDSYRTYDLTDEMVSFFTNIIQKRKELQEFYGNTYHHSEYLFTWEDGRPFRPDYIYHHFKRIMKEYGRPEFTFHNLRHTTASVLFEQGWSAKDIQEWLGYADYYTTMNIYTHIEKSHKREKAETLNGIMELPPEGLC